MQQEQGEGPIARSAQLALPGKSEWLRGAAVAAAIAVVALLCFVPVSSNDFWLQAAVGRIIWTTGEIPRTALFPFTEARDFPFHAHEWLSSVAFYLLEDHLGHDALLFVKGFLGLALFALCARLAYRASASFTVSLLVALAAMIVANYRFFLRPELFALLLTAGLITLLVEYRLAAKKRYLIACLPVAVLWVNLHGSAPIAVAIAVLFALGAALDVLRGPSPGGMRGAALAAAPYAACAAGMACAMLANPYGAAAYSYAWNVENAAFLRTYIYEWTPTLSGPFVGSRGFWAFLAFVAAAAALVLRRWKSLPSAGALLLVVFGYLALEAQRHIAFFAIASIYPLSAALRDDAVRLQRMRFVPAAVVALLVGCAGLLFRYGNMYGGYPYFVASPNFSPALVEYLAQPKLHGNVLNSYALGSELAYRAYPRLRPAIDSRIDVYGERYFLRMLALDTDEAALREFVQRHDVGYMLLARPDFDDGVRRMPHIRAGWRILFADHKAVLLGHK